MQLSNQKVYPSCVSHAIFDNIIEAVYLTYLVNGRNKPSVDDIKEHCRHTTRIIATVLDTEEFKDAIALKGIYWRDEDGLSTSQMLAIQILTNPNDRRTMTAKLKSIGVSHAQYRAWCRLPLFKSRVEKISEDMLQDNIASVHQAVLNKATGGDVRAAELVYQLTGRYDPAKQQALQLNAMVMLLLEIITKHVTDSSTLKLISSDVDTIIMPKLEGH